MSADSARAARARAFSRAACLTRDLCSLVLFSFCAGARIVRGVSRTHLATSTIYRRVVRGLFFCSAPRRRRGDGVRCRARSEPLYIVELGAGSGKFSYYMLQALNEMQVGGVCGGVRADGAPAEERRRATGDGGRGAGRRIPAIPQGESGEASVTTAARSSAPGVATARPGGRRRDPRGSATSRSRKSCT